MWGGGQAQPPTPSKAGVTGLLRRGGVKEGAFPP